MVAYIAVMSLIPIVLLALFGVSIVLESASARTTLLLGLERIFPAAARGTLTSSLDAVQNAKLSLAGAALVTSTWAGISLWSALDTAFRGIYGYPARGWLEQKRWAAKMLVAGLGLVVVFIATPAAQSLLAAGTTRLPFGLGNTGAIVWIVSAAAHAALFTGLCVVYRFVPRGRPPWSAIWPGALVALLLVTAISMLFPLYLTQVTTLAHAATAFTFVVIILTWFYLLALATLIGAAVNAARLAG